VNTHWNRSRFIHDQHFFILVDNPDGIGSHRWFMSMDRVSYQVTVSDNVAGEHFLAVDGDFTSFDGSFLRLVHVEYVHIRQSRPSAWLISA
jgi:hypothetical protein